MIIGIDFDNTIVCYDNTFYDIALERGLISETIGKTKKEVKEFLISNDNEDKWTELQGIVYGPKIKNAKPFPGVLDFLSWCKENKIKTYIISHKTKHPFIGEKYDLHNYARMWLQENGFFNFQNTGLTRNDSYFLTTKEEKIKKATELNCDYFIDDLPEIFNLDNFSEKITPILFDPQQKHTKKITTINSWNELKHLIKLKEKISLLFNIQIEKINQIKEGKNNQGFEIIKKDQTKLFLKKYFYHSLDKRDRLFNEYSFVNFCWNKKIFSVPKPLKQNKKEKIGLFEYIEGRKLAEIEITTNHIQQAVSFFKNVNKHKNSVEAKLLPLASEACFSIQEHINCVKRRITKLQQIEENNFNKEVIDFIKTELCPLYNKVVKNIYEKTKKKNISLSEYVLEEEKCISPSDFGFHNALINKEGEIIFIDFEYAGWDDPAKMICDFFCQPAIPVPEKYWKNFTEKVFNNNQQKILRSEILLPLYKVKWCCIILNEFLKCDCARRHFSQREFKIENKKYEQLNKAKLYLKNIKFNK